MTETQTEALDKELADSLADVKWCETLYENADKLYRNSTIVNMQYVGYDQNSANLYQSCIFARNKLNKAMHTLSILTRIKNS